MSHFPKRPRLTSEPGFPRTDEIQDRPEAEMPAAEDEEDELSTCSFTFSYFSTSSSTTSSPGILSTSEDGKGEEEQGAGLEDEGEEEEDEEETKEGEEEEEKSRLGQPQDRGWHTTGLWLLVQARGSEEAAGDQAWAEPQRLPF